MWEVVLFAVLGGATVFGLAASQLDKASRPKLPEGPRKPLEPDPPSGPLADVATRFQLQFRDGVARGTVRSVDLALRELQGDGQRRAYELRARVPLPHGFELSVRPGRTLRPVLFVNPGFDAALAIESSDLLRAQALLRGSAGDDLLRAALEDWKPVLDQEKLTFTLPVQAHARDLRRAVELLVTLARALQVGGAQPLVESERVRDPVQQRAFVNWRVLADRWGAELDRDPVVLELQRPVGTLRVSLAGSRRRGFETLVELTPARPFSTSMELFKAERLSKRDPRRKNDIVIGTRELDDGFVINGEEDDVQQRLTMPAQAALVALGTRCSELQVLPNSLQVAVNEAITDAERLAELCRSVESVARELLPDSQKRAYR
jgi:hypothetical protein